MNRNRFAEPGEVLFSNIVIQKLSYLEFKTVHGLDYLFIRPVIKYEVLKEKGFFLEYRFFPNISNQSIALRTRKRVFYKDGTKVKSSDSLDLVQTSLVLDVINVRTNITSKIEYVKMPNKDYKLKLNLYERIKINDLNLTHLNKSNKIFLKKTIQNNQYVAVKSILATMKLLVNTSGIVLTIKNKSNIEMLVLKEHLIKTCVFNSIKETLYVQEGSLVRIGTYLTSKTRSPVAGQVYKIEHDKIFIRLGRPYLISKRTVLRADSGSIVEKSDILATLVYKTLKTVDIVQGLPKVEELLEARKLKNKCFLAPSNGHVYLKNKKIEIVQSPNDKVSINVGSSIKVNFRNGQYVQCSEPLTDGSISPHEKLEILFNYYRIKYHLYEACKKSFKLMQLFLVSEVQRTYLSQGVQIADKHIEIIVKQMTSKVLVSDGGETTLLPGTIIALNKAELLTKSSIPTTKEPLMYKPVLLGLTKASLNSESFISAASFQETTRVLTEAAIEGKRDWLNGLKENVIIGRLIPAGTGFKSFENVAKIDIEQTMDLFINKYSKRKLKDYVLKSRLI